MSALTLLIVFQSATGGTRQMAEAAAAREEAAINVRLLTAPEAGPADVMAADGHLFAIPENLANVSGLKRLLRPVL